jgi:ParB-like chromosome segregation protein Spo0J
MTDLAFHPLANVFPLLEGEEFAALVADIQASGLCEAIWLYQGQILDGRNRYRACQALGRDCATRPYTGDDPLSFVLSMNLRRRHLDESQRGMVAARLATMRQGERTDLRSIERKLSQDDVAELLNVGIETVKRATKVQHTAAQEIVQAVDTGIMTLAAALPLTEVPKEDQPRLLEEVRHEAGEKRPTATQTRAAVSKVQVVATVKEQMAAGKDAKEAVTHALQKHAIVVPTPALADAICVATDRQVTLAATDGLLHDGRTKAEEAAIMAQTKRLFQLFHALEALATLPALEELVAEIPDYAAYRVDRYLDQACTTLVRFATLWTEQRLGAAYPERDTHGQNVMVPDAPVPVQEPQRSRQPKKGRARHKRKQAQPHAAPKAKTRQPARSVHAAAETALSQPDLLLAALRTAQQPLMIEDLRQISGVGGSRLKRNVSRLVVQGKIQETPLGYVMVSA